MCTDVLETADIETASEDYASRFTGTVGKYFLDIQESITLELLKPYRGSQILDIGGGHAQLALPLVSNGYDLTVLGSDKSCRERLDRILKANKYRFKVGNVVKLDYPDNSFDIVMSYRLVPHVNQWRKLLSEMCRVAKRVVIFDYPDIRSFNILYKILFGLKKTFEGNTRPFQAFSRKQISEELFANGFMSADFRPQFFFPMVVHRKLGSAHTMKLLEEISDSCGLRNLFGTPIIVRALESNEPL